MRPSDPAPNPGWFRRLAVLPPPQQPPVGGWRERGVTWLVGAAVGGWILAFKLRAYFGLGTTSDMYIVSQLATSWLDGRYLQDNYFGNQLATHTFLSAPMLGLLVKPFGPPGLFGVLAVSAAAGLVGLERLLRALGVSRWPALGFALLCTIMPLTMRTYQDVVYGFHIELVVPALAAWLGYFLVVRHWRGSLLTGLALLSVKEDAVLVALPLAGMVLVEDLVRHNGRGFRQRWTAAMNRPALAVAMASIVAVPVLLLILKSQQVAGTPSNLGRLHPVGGEAITSNAALIGYFLRNLGTWLQSAVVWRWLDLALVGTFGLIVLRPHLLGFGVATTLTSWLMQDELLWEPRFVQALSFFQMAACLAFASAWSLAASGRAAVRWVAGAALVIGIVAGVRGQWQAVPAVAGIYRLTPTLPVDRATRGRADRLYEIYSREHRPGEATIASDWLFRYADVDDLYWYSKLRSRPVPEWILWDRDDKPLNVLRNVLRTEGGTDLLDYRLVAQDGRFLLYRRKAAAELAAAQSAAGPRIGGEDHGMIRLKVKLPEGRGGLVEPLLSVGSAGRGDLFFIRYLTDRQLVLGLESIGTKVEISPPIDFEPEREYEVALFTGLLLPPAGQEPVADRSAEWRLYYQGLIGANWNGREVMRTLVPSRAVPADVVIGRNTVQAGSVAAARFTGEVLTAGRGGYPGGEGAPVPGAEFGAVRFTLQLPRHAAAVPEPLIVAGAPGDATLAYIRILPGNQVTLGAEFWGFAAQESSPQAVEAGKPVEVVFELPLLYPAPGDVRWDGIPSEVQKHCRSTVRILLNGKVVLEEPVQAPVPRIVAPNFGRNPLGGSWVSIAFTGEILQVARLPLGEPAAGDAQP